MTIMQIRIKSAVILSFLLISKGLFAQEKHSIGIHYLHGWNEMYQPQLVGAASHKGNGSSQWGMHYSYGFNEKTRLITGFSLTRSRFTTTPAPVNPPQTSYEAEIGFMSIPIGIDYDFSKYFYISGSLLFDVQFSKTKDSSIDDQSGIGLAAGIGGKYQYKRLIFYVQPLIQMHSVISFQESWKHERMLETGIEAGLAVNF